VRMSIFGRHPEGNPGGEGCHEERGSETKRRSHETADRSGVRSASQTAGFTPACAGTEIVSLRTCANAIAIPTETAAKMRPNSCAGDFVVGRSRFRCRAVRYRCGRYVGYGTAAAGTYLQKIRNAPAPGSPLIPTQTQTLFLTARVLGHAHGAWERYSEHTGFEGAVTSRQRAHQPRYLPVAPENECRLSTSYRLS